MFIVNNMNVWWSDVTVINIDFDSFEPVNCWHLTKIKTYLIRYKFGALFCVFELAQIPEYLLFQEDSML